MVGLRQKGHSGGPVDRLLRDLAEHFEIACSESDPGLYRVKVDYARFPDEAVVKVVCALDEIDAGWQEIFAWPEVIDSHAEGDEGPAA